MRYIDTSKQVLERFYDAEFFEAGNKVVVACRLVTCSRLTGTVMDHPMVQVVTVKDSKIIDFRPFYWNVPDYIAAATPFVKD